MLPAPERFYRCNLLTIRLMIQYSTTLLYHISLKITRVYFLYPIFERNDTIWQKQKNYLQVCGGHWFMITLMKMERDTMNNLQLRPKENLNIWRLNLPLVRKKLLLIQKN